MTVRNTAVATPQWETPFARCTHWRFSPGTETGWHTHQFDYAVVPLTDGLLVLERAEGEGRRVLKQGESYSGVRGTEHNVINGGEVEVVFLEIELLRG